MSRKVIIGSVAVATAGYLLYERRLQLQQQMPVQVSPTAREEPDKFEKVGARTGAKLDDVRNDLNDKVSKSKEEADYQFQNLATRVEGKKADVAGWAADKADAVQTSLEETKDKYQETEKKLMENVNEYKEERKDSKAVKVYNTTKDNISHDWNNIKEGIKEDLQSIKDVFVDNGENPTSELSSKGAEQIENAQQTLSQATASSKRTVNEAVPNAKDKSMSILNWGFNREEKARAVAISKYDEAHKRFDELNKELQETRKGLFDSGDKELRKKVDDAKQYLEECKRQLDEASQEYAQKTQQDFSQLADELHANEEELKRKGFLTWLRGKADHQVDDADQVASSSVVGWGETAEQLAKEELEEKLRNEEIGPSEAQRRLERLKEIKNRGWFTYRADDEEVMAQATARSLEGWGETASIMAQEEYEDLVRWREAGRKRFEKNNSDARTAAEAAKKEASTKLELAKKELSNQTKRWWQFGKEKNDELHKLAKEKYEVAQEEYEDAANKVREWTDKATGKFWSSADDSLHAAKQSASSTHEATQKALDKAEDYVKGEKN